MILDWLVALVALYGAFVSTILAIKELNRERKKVSIFFVINDFEHTISILITNIRVRPITLIGISIELPMAGDMPKDMLLGRDSNNNRIWPFPVTLLDGGHTLLELSDEAVEKIDILDIRDKKVNIAVFDTEGNSHHEYDRLYFSSKFGAYQKTRKQKFTIASYFQTLFIARKIKKSMNKKKIGEKNKN